MNVPLKEYRNLLATYLMPQAHRVGVLAVLLFASIGLQLVNPQILRYFIDTVSSRGSYDALVYAAMLFIAVALVQRVVAVIATYISERMGWSATNALRADLTLHLLKLDLSFHKAHTPGEMIERVDGDVTSLANFFSQFVIQVIGNLLLLIGVLLVLWGEDWRAGMALTIFAAVVLVSMIKVRAVAVPYWQAFRQASADLFGFLEERLSGTADIRSSGAQAYTMRRLYVAMRERLRTGSKARLVGSIPWSVPILFYVLGNIISFLLAAYLYHAGAQIGTAFLLYYYTQLMVRPLNQITNQLDDFQKASASIVRIGELMSTHSKLEDGPGAIFPDGPLAVEFENVSFGYGEEEMVVKDLTFRIEPGTVMGLLGRTGSGKTTITRLLFRLYDPDAGCIRLNGIDLRQSKRADLRRHIGMVTQEVQLFHASVRDNMTLFDPSIDDERIRRALDSLGLTGWLESLPDGLDTVLAAGGGGLSAGEAQLLAFTRIFLRDPGVIILDEASSRLDPATERLLEMAIDKLLQGRTAIIIAHRLSTIQRADTILVLDKGRISEYGTRRSLALDAGSHFAQLLRTAHEEVPA